MTNENWEQIFENPNTDVLDPQLEKLVAAAIAAEKGAHKLDVPGKIKSDGNLLSKQVAMASPEKMYPT